MKILLYYLYGGGGAAQNMKVLYSALANSPSVSKLVVVCSAKSPLYDLISQPKVKIISADYLPSREMNRLFMGLAGLKSIVARERPDVVLAINLSSYARLAVPTVLTINNPYQVYPRDIDVHHPRGPRGALLLRWFSTLSLAQVDALILQTDLMRSYAVAAAGRPLPSWTIGKSVEDEANVAFLPLPEPARRALDASKSDVFTFLYAATPAPHKNHRVLYPTMEVLRARGAGVRLLLTLSADEVRGTGGELGTSLVESGHVVPLGFLTKAHLRAAYDVTDACVMPSVLESLSSAHLEAMAWAKPQVAVDLPYARDLCRDAALYCPADDARSWAEAMQRVCDDKALRESLVTAGRQVMDTMPKTVGDAAARLEAALREVVRTARA